MHVTDRPAELARRRTSPIAFSLIALLSVGCDDDDEAVSVVPGSITIYEDRNWSYDDSIYEWTSPGPVARLQLFVDDFNHGDMAITIFDARGRIIYAQVYWTFDWYWYIDWEFSDLDFTDSGEPGLWTILLEYYEFTGNVTLVVESTTEPQTDPDVPPPTTNSALLDLTFGSSGRAAYAPDASGARRVAVDAMGRVVAAGTIVEDDGSRRISVWRFTAAGALDSSFGSGGVYSFDDPSVFSSGATDVALDSANRVLVCGWVGDEDRRTDLAILRLGATGIPDASFGTAGLVTLDDGEYEVGTALAADTTGRILVTGSSRTVDNSTGRMLLARLTTAGAFDASFATAGVYRSADPADRGWDLATAPNDRPVVLGLQGGATVLWRLTEGGALDPTFGAGGIVVSAGGADEARVGRALTVQPDGATTVVGFRIYENDAQPEEMLVWAFNADGSPRISFNGSGFLAYRYPNGYAAARSVAVDALGRLLVAGFTRSSTATETDSSATLWRFFSTGALDGTLPGSNGSGVTRFDPRSPNAGTAAGCIVLSGSSSAFAVGTAFDRSDGAADAIVWKLKP